MKIDPLLIDIPEQFTTERLLIRTAMNGDGAALNEAIVESIAELRPWMPWAQSVPTPEESEAYSRRARSRFLLREDLPLRFFLKQTGQFVGSSGLHRIDWEVPKFEIGYWVRTSMAGRGYVTEAVGAIADFALQKLSAQRVEIRCDERNDRSCRVAERCRFELEATLRRDSRAPDGTLRNTRVYTRLAAS
jgi:RimJ/RimL family protein N-acetyltransferase